MEPNYLIDIYQINESLDEAESFIVFFMALDKLIEDDSIEHTIERSFWLFLGPYQLY